ncbi:MAG: Flp family type IVb pilin [Tindallia sp. MSAO_Bac2]|nr:MAG: Flp family type IVb pilin [Tindallia sp. MSAO_Bac2]
MMEKMMKLMKDESGQGMAEYGLILAGVAVVVMVALVALGGGLTDLFDRVTDDVTEDHSPTP